MIMAGAFDTTHRGIFLEREEDSRRQRRYVDSNAIILGVDIPKRFLVSSSLDVSCISHQPAFRGDLNKSFKMYERKVTDRDIRPRRALS